MERNRRGKPYYDLERVKALAASDMLSTSKRVRGWLGNHGYCPHEEIKLIVSSLCEGDLYKSDELEVMPGVIADIYRTTCDGEDWYVKLFLDEDTGMLRVRVLSCCWDSSVH